MNQYFRHIVVFLSVIIMALGSSIYFKISENYALGEKINQIEAKKISFKQFDHFIKKFFWRHKNDLEEIPEILIRKYGKRSALIQHEADHKISCNGLIVNDDEDLKKIEQILEQAFFPYFLEYGEEFSIYYEYYTPGITETVPYQYEHSNFIEVPEIFTSSEGRYRIDFYIIENPYVRMSLKYLSIDDLNGQSMRARKIFGERIAPRWFYFFES